MKAVQIVGGGLAGLTLGLRLRQLDVPVELYEAGSYPRHRVCGEYLSGRGHDFLRSLIPEEILAQAGARRSTGLRVFRGDQKLRDESLPRPALCLSRHRLDQLLAERLASVGGRIHLQTRKTSATQEGWVAATGRQPAVREEGWRWIGLKAHALDLSMGRDLEMHLTPHGYVGLCAVEENRVNVCGLFRTRETIPDLAQNWRNWLGGEPGSALHRRLQGARWDEDSFSSVSAISLRPRRAAEQSGVRIGDALTMIPPLTGNGMSMAVEGGFLSAEPLAEWARGNLDWPTCCQRVARKLDRSFYPPPLGPSSPTVHPPPSRPALSLASFLDFPLSSPAPLPPNPLIFKLWGQRSFKSLSNRILHACFSGFGVRGQIFTAKPAKTERVGNQK